jgi:hypothetical protein
MTDLGETARLFRIVDKMPLINLSAAAGSSRTLNRTGNAPYLIADGWTVLLNGKDLSGW